MAKSNLSNSILLGGIKRMLYPTSFDSDAFNIFVVIDDRYISYYERKSQGLPTTLTLNECTNDLKILNDLLTKYKYHFEQKIINNRIREIESIINEEFKISA